MPPLGVFSHPPPPNRSAPGLRRAPPVDDRTLPGQTPAADRPGPIQVLVNSAAGRGGGAERVYRVLAAHGVSCRVRSVPPERLATEIRALVSGAEPVVAVAGGDGSMVTAAQILAGTGTALAVFPLGTLNRFARRLGLDTLHAAAGALAGGRVAPLPVGILDDRVFLNTVTFGLYADVVRRRDQLARGRLARWPAAVLALLVTLARHRLVDVSLEAAEGRVRQRTPVVWVGLGRGSFSGGGRQGPWSDLLELEVVLASGRGRAGTLALMARTALVAARGGPPANVSGLRVLHAERFLLRSRHPVGITLDGESSRTGGPVFVGVQPAALRVLVPPPSREG